MREEETPAFFFFLNKIHQRIFFIFLHIAGKEEP